VGYPQCHGGGTIVARVIVVAEPETDPPGTNRDRRTFQLKEREESDCALRAGTRWSPTARERLRPRG